MQIHRRVTKAVDRSAPSRCTFFISDKGYPLRPVRVHPEMRYFYKINGRRYFNGKYITPRPYKQADEAIE